MKARLFVLGVLALGTVLLMMLPQVPTPVAAQGPTRSGPTIGHAVATGVSPALRSLPASPSHQVVPRVVPLHRAVNPQATLSSPSRVIRDPVVQKAPGRTTISPTIQNFEGTNDFNNYYPPDTNGDIGYDPATGKKYYVQWVNVGYQVWDVTSMPTSVMGPVDASLLWAGLTSTSPCQTLTSFTSNGGDPVVLFDSLSQRWLASAFANNGGGPYHQCVALSKTADTSGQYWLYDFILSSTMFNDYPKFAVWPDGYYLTVNQFGGSNGVGAFVFERAKMLSGDTSASFQYFNLPNQSNMQPSNLNGPNQPPTGSPNYFVQLGYDGSGNPQSPLQVWQFHTDWAVTTNSTITLLTTLPVAAFNTNLCNFSASCIPEPPVSGQTVQSLDALSDRLMYRLQYRNFGSYETMVVNHTVAVGDFANHAGIRWYEFRKYGSGAWSIYQQGTYAPDANHRWMGSIAMDGEGQHCVGLQRVQHEYIPLDSLYWSIRN